MNIMEYEGKWAGTGIDLDTVTHICICGSSLWHIVASFDNYEIATYSTDMRCLECGAKAKAPTPLDDPSYQP